MPVFVNVTLTDLQKSIIVVLYQYIVVDRSLAKVGIEGSNPFARSSFR